jgi:PHD/YefM family antitoxin component YafN of YafNO toxin-antitoxin module
MKLIYETPVMEVVEFEAEDVITTSDYDPDAVMLPEDEF